MIYLMTGILLYFSTSCSSFTTSTNIIVDSADVHGIRYEKVNQFESKQ